MRLKAILITLFLLVLPFFMIGYYHYEQPDLILPSQQSIAWQQSENPYIQELLVEYEQIIDGMMKYTQIPGAAIAIVKDTSIIYLKGFGVKTVGTYDSVDCNTVFRLGSVSKCFASVLTGILASKNKLSWSDPVIQYVPEFAMRTEENTELLNIEHVLSHTVGLPYHTYTNLVEEGWPLDTMLHRLRNIHVFSRPGQVYSYQNVAYSLIDKIVLTATGKTYNDLMEQEIFRPLNMTNASITYRGIKENDNVAQPHLLRRRSWRSISISDKYYNVAPAGGINASITDMAQWMQALLGNKPSIIDKNTLDKIYAPYVSAKSKNRNYRNVAPVKETFYALGWRVLHYPTDTLIYHGGYVNGYRSEVALDRDDKIAICILTNAPGDVADTAIPAFLKLYMTKRQAIRNWEKGEPNLLANLMETTYTDHSFSYPNNPNNK